MVTDSAFYRNPHYHTAADTIDRLNYEFMAQLVESLLLFFRSLTANPAPQDLMAKQSIRLELMILNFTNCYRIGEIAYSFSLTDVERRFTKWPRKK
jgi:hypothetical protein